MGVIDGPVTDFRHKALSRFNTRRDIKLALVAAWDFSEQLDTYANGAAVTRIKDGTGNGYDLIVTGGTAKTNALGTLPSLNLGATGYANIWKFFSAAGLQAQTAALAQPLTLVFVAKANSPAGTGQRTLFAGSGISVIQESTTGDLRLNAGSNGAVQGNNVADGNWHIYTVSIGTTKAEITCDGVVTATAATQTHGTGTASTVILGASNTSGANPWNGELSYAAIIQGYMTAEQLADVASSLASPRGLSLAQPITPTTLLPYAEPPDAMVYSVSVTEPVGSQALQVYQPRRMTTTTPLVIYNHQQGTATAPFDGYQTMNLIANLVAMGCCVIAGANHGTDGWTSDNAQADQANILTYMGTLVSGWAGPIIVYGQSMGGALTAISRCTGKYGARLKGLVLVDAAVNLSWMYNNGYDTSINTGFGLTAGTLSAALASTGATSLPTTASYPTVGTQLLVGIGTANVETVTTTGASTGTAVAVTATTKTHASGEKVSNYPTVTASYDPVLRSASDYGTTPVAVFASTGDTTVSSTNNSSQLITLLGSNPVELYRSIGATGLHLASATLDILAIVKFVQRCLAR